MKKIKKKNKSPESQSLFRLNSTDAPLSRREDCPLLERASQCYALILLTLFPLLHGTDNYYNITVSKFIYFSVLTCLYAVLCLVLALVFRPGRQVGSMMRERRKAVFTVPQLFLIAYALWAVICTLVSPYPDLWLGQSRYEGLFSLLLYSAVFVLLSFWGEYTDAYTYGLGAMGIVTGFIAMIQTFGSTVFFDNGMSFFNTQFLTTIGNVDCVACLVCILIPALLCGFVILRSPWRWLGYPALFFMTYLAMFMDVDTAKLGFAAVVLLLPCLIQSRDRLQNLLVGLIPILLGAALGLSYHRDRSFTPGSAAFVLLAGAAAMALAAWYMHRHERTWSVKPSTIRRVAYALLLLLLIITLIVVYRYDGANKLMKEASAFLHGNLGDRAGANRGFIWKTTVKIIRERPVFGGGPGSFLSLFMPYQAEYQSVCDKTDWIDFAHNDFLSVAACTGLVGLALYLIFLAALAVRCIRAAHRSPVMLIFLGGMAGYLIYSFFVFSIAIVSPLFWTLAGLADHCVRQLESSSNLSRGGERPGASASPASRN